VKIGDILLIILLVLVFWGPSRLGGLGKGIGAGIRNFRKGLRGDASPDQPEETPSSQKPR
jgi:sec-independent protein translocase protein TatA